MAEIIATTTLDCVSSLGEHHQVIVEIGRPYQAPEGEWACPVAMRGLYNCLRDVRGEDSLQALCLAASLVRMLLTSFVEDGGQIFFPNSNSEYDLDATFSNVGSGSPHGPRSTKPCS
jgi:hypothetical protein